MTENLLTTTPSDITSVDSTPTASVTTAAEVAVPLSAATLAVLEEIDQAKANVGLAAELIAAGEPLPADVELLPLPLRHALGADDVDLWPQIKQPGREKLLLRATRNRQLSAERRYAQLQRQDHCAYYIDTLCRLTQTSRAQVGDEMYDTLRGEYEAAKTAWNKVRGKSKRTRPTYASRLGTSDAE
jgi:hypothetical protein